MTSIALTMMVKNEEQRITTTIQSVIGYVDHVIILDTGSTDQTLSIIRTFCSKHQLPLHVRQTSFVNFCTTRNEELVFADITSTKNNIDYLLLLDCNDELQGGESLRQFCEEMVSSDQDAWLVQQTWFSGTYTQYYNVRLIRSNHGWRYKGVVHEYIYNTKRDVYVRNKVKGVCIYQDRTQDDDKTKHRFQRDKQLLQREHEQHPTDARTLFYLAQTYECLRKHGLAYIYYSKRTLLGGFDEEVFHSYLRMGDIARNATRANEAHPENRITLEQDDEDTSTLRRLDWKDALYDYIKASETCLRAEPLLRIAEYYKDHHRFELAFHFARMACEIPFPNDTILFVDTEIYEYTRFHVMGIVSFYCARYEEGEEACRLAIEARDKDIDKKNIEFYW